MTVRNLLFLLLLVSFGPVAIAQADPCATPARMTGDPPSAEDVRLMKELRRTIGSAGQVKNDSDLLIIPTVVHVIHYGSLGNISDAQVLDGLRVVNEDFQRLNADTVDTDPLFLPFAANVGMEFRLATIDPDGDPTTGIVRLDTNLVPHPEPVDPDFDNVKFASHWPEDMYFNIWITRSIQGGAAGYAQYPGTGFTYGGPWHTWGPIVRSNQWGTIGTSSGDGRTATHEIGHCFGLYHTFLSANAGCGAACDTTGDEVCDTPPCLLGTGCPQNNTCANDTVGPSVYVADSFDQQENYMSYNSCQNLFTLGQMARMRGFYHLFDTIANLSLPGNLAATGTLDVVAVEELASPLFDLRIHPNPNSGSFLLSVTGPVDEAEYHIHDPLGRVVQRGRLQQEGAWVDLSRVGAGLFTVRVQVDGGTATERVVVE